VVSSSGVDTRPYSDGGCLFNRVFLPSVTRVLGKILYDDRRRMESLVRDSDLDWPIVRPSGLYHLPSATDYTVVEGHADGRFTASLWKFEPTRPGGPFHVDHSANAYSSSSRQRAGVPPVK
jgi:hypothetical protein